MDGKCKNTTFSSYNQFNKLLGLCVYRREIQSTSYAYIADIEKRIDAFQKKYSQTENEIIIKERQPISTKCQVTFLNPDLEGSAKNPRIYTLPCSSINLKIKNGFLKIIQTIPNKGIILLRCIAEDGLGGFMCPHENQRYNLYVICTPHANESIQLLWSEINGTWSVLDYSGHFENVTMSDVFGSGVNFSNSSIGSIITETESEFNKRIENDKPKTTDYTIEDTTNNSVKISDTKTYVDSEGNEISTDLVQEIINDYLKSENATLDPVYTTLITGDSTDVVINKDSDNTGSTTASTSSTSTSTNDSTSTSTSTSTNDSTTASTSTSTNDSTTASTSTSTNDSTTASTSTSTSTNYDGSSSTDNNNEN